MAISAIREEVLSSGHTYGYVLPNIQRMLLAGAFPGASGEVAREFISTALDKIERLSDEQIANWQEFSGRVVASMVRTVDGANVELSWEEVDDPDGFPQDDRAQLWSRAIRIQAAPKAMGAP